MWEIQQSPAMKTHSLPRRNPVRCSEKFGTVKTNYRSYRDFLQSFNESGKTSDEQESVSSVDSGISSFQLSESKSINNSLSSIDSDCSVDSQYKKSDTNGPIKSSSGSYRQFLENYSTKKFSSVKPTLPAKKNVKSEIFIQVGEDNSFISRNRENNVERLKNSLNSSNGKVSINLDKKVSPIRDGTPKSNKPNSNTSSLNNFNSDKPITEDLYKRMNGFTNGKAVEAIKKFNDLSKREENINANNVGRTKTRPSVVKSDIVPERSSFINGRTSPFNVPSEKTQESQKILIREAVKPNNPVTKEQINEKNVEKEENRKVSSKFLQEKPFLKQEQSNGKPLLKGKPLGRDSTQTKISANVKQISEELNKINSRLLNGKLNKINGQQKDSNERKMSSDESLNSSNEFLNHDETDKANRAETEQVLEVTENVQIFSAPPPPPPLPPPMTNFNSQSLTSSPKKWEKIKTEENAKPQETQKPKETNQAAMNLAKILIESRKLRKTKSADDCLEEVTENGSEKTSPDTSTTLTHISSRHNNNNINNYHANMERTPSPTQKNDAQPLKSTFSGQMCGRVSVTPSLLRRTMSDNNPSSIIDANTTTVVSISDKNAKIEKTDPNVKKLVYNTYRGLLGAYNPKANDIIATLPRNMVREDQGVSKQLESIALQGGLDKINGRINPKSSEKE